MFDQRTDAAVRVPDAEHLQLILPVAPGTTDPQSRRLAPASRSTRITQGPAAVISGGAVAFRLIRSSARELTPYVTDKVPVFCGC